MGLIYFICMFASVYLCSLIDIWAFQTFSKEVWKAALKWNIKVLLNGLTGSLLWIAVADSEMVINSIHKWKIQYSYFHIWYFPPNLFVSQRYSYLSLHSVSTFDATCVNPERTVLPLSPLNLLASWINMAVFPRSLVILAFNNTKSCNPSGFNLILPQLTNSSSLHSYKSRSLHCSLWGCHPCRSSLGMPLLSSRLEHWVLGSCVAASSHGQAGGHFLEGVCWQ